MPQSASSFEQSFIYQSFWSRAPWIYHETPWGDHMCPLPPLTAPLNFNLLNCLNIAEFLHRTSDTKAFGFVRFKPTMIPPGGEGGLRYPPPPPPSPPWGTPTDLNWLNCFNMTEFLHRTSGNKTFGRVALEPSMIIGGGGEGGPLGAPLPPLFLEGPLEIWIE